MNTFCIIVDYIKRYFSSLVCFCIQFVCIFIQFKLEFTINQSTTSQFFRKLKCCWCSCWSRWNWCFISVSEDTFCIRIFYSRNQLTLTVIYYIHFNCVRFSWVSHTWLCSCFFSDSVSVLSCFCVVDVKDNLSWSSILSRSYNYIFIFNCFFQFESISISYKFFTIQDFLSFDSSACFSCFISVGESNVLCIWCCNKLTLAVIFNDYIYFISIRIVFNSGYITCFFRDSVCISFFFCELKFWELNLTVCSVFSCRNDFVTFFFFQLKFKFSSFKGFTVQDFLSFKLKFCFFSCVWVCKFFLRIFKFDAC